MFVALQVGVADFCAKKQFKSINQIKLLDVGLKKSQRSAGNTFCIFVRLGFTQRGFRDSSVQQLIRLRQIGRVLKQLTSFFGQMSPTHGRQSLLIFISQVECNIQVLVERIYKFGIHFEHVQQIVSRNFVKVTVGQGTYVARRFADRCALEWILTKNIVFAFQMKNGFNQLISWSMENVCNLIEGFKLPNMATTLSSFKISIVPRAMKYNETSTSPRWTSVSPGGAWVVLNLVERARRQPGDASDSWLKSRRKRINR